VEEGSKLKAVTGAAVSTAKKIVSSTAQGMHMLATVMRTVGGGLEGLLGYDTRERKKPKWLKKAI
jgi:hypothetical protein